MNGQSVTIPGAAIGLPMLIHLSRERTHTANRITWHSHDGFELLFLLQGATAYEFSDHQTVELHGGHFLVIPPGQEHRGRHDIRSPSAICGLAFRTTPARAWRHTCFTVGDVRRLHRTLQGAGLQEHPFNPALGWLARRLIQETASFSPNPSPLEAGAALRALICAVLVETCRQMQAPPVPPREFVAAAIDYLRQHLHEPVNMSDLVRHVGFSRARLFDLFKTQTGLTPNDYLQRLRVEKAREQLRHTDLPVTEIALAAGFSSLQYFSTVFGRYTGLSPSRFRRRGANEPPGRSLASPASGPAVSNPGNAGN